MRKKEDIEVYMRECSNCKHYDRISKSMGHCMFHAITVWNTKKRDEVTRAPLVYDYHVCLNWE